MKQKESHVRVLESTPLRGCRNHENVRQQESRVAMIISRSIYHVSNPNEAPKKNPTPMLVPMLSAYCYAMQS